MARCRIGYLMALAAAGLFFVSFSDWFSFYILALALVFPFFSLAVSLPGMLGCRVSLDAPGGAVRRGSGHEAGLRVENRWGLPVGRVAVDLSCRNLMTGQTGTVRRKGVGGSLGMDFREPLDTSHCGCLRWEVRRVRVCDLLGIFSIRRAVPQAARVLVLPLNLPAEGVKGLMGMEDKNPVMKPRPGGGPGEDYDLRPYRPGDPLRSVHWKLSSKVDDLVVRETLEPRKTAILLTFDLYGPAEVLDRAFDRLDAVSRGLIEAERGHYVQWIQPGTLEVRTRYVSDIKELRALQWEMFSTPAPMEGRSLRDVGVHIDGVDGPIRRLHMTPTGEGEAR